MKLGVVITLWLSVLGVGVWQLEHYANAPGESAVSVERWPQDASIARSDSVPTLVMFVHPRCPCSRASVGELNRLCSRFGDHARIFVAFVTPDRADRDWADTDLFRSAARIPQVEAVIDVAGRDAEAFGAKTSGQTFLYGADGVLLFSGGITASRGHHGDNAGRALLERQIDRPSKSVERSSVFGCALFSRPQADAVSS